jgi:threonine synthase
VHDLDHGRRRDAAPRQELGHAADHRRPGVLRGRGRLADEHRAVRRGEDEVGEGKKTLAYEIAEQTGFRLPDVVVFPVAVGEAFIAGWRALNELRALGWIEGLPVMVAAQSATANPIVRAFRTGGPLRPVPLAYTVAEGLAVGDPGAKGAWVLRILRESGGLAADADDALVLDTQRLLARTEGLYAGPTGVGALAAVRRLVADGALDPARSICCVITETGLKSEAPPVPRTGERLDYERLASLVRERLGLS